MRKILFFILCAGISFSVGAQQIVNDELAEKRSVGSFHGIEVSTGIMLVLTSGSSEEIAVSAAKTEYRDHIVTKVENGILKIYYENKMKAPNTRKESKELKAYVAYRELDQLDANTGAIVNIQGVLKAKSLKMKVNTGAIVNGKVDLLEMEVNQDTGSIVTLSGEAGKLKVEGDTGSMFKGSNLRTDNCNAKTSTGAGIYIQVDKELYAKANTGGFLKYKGNAGVKEIVTHTGGSVKKI
ncbi:MAG: DUF2807 domain-containing protein [Chitinophagaceae bacterium]|nr:DUF2807 domain-containing protein [Chitinophagaceae bacterium]